MQDFENVLGDSFLKGIVYVDDKEFWQTKSIIVDNWMRGVARYRGLPFDTEFNNVRVPLCQPEILQLQKQTVNGDILQSSERCFWKIYPEFQDTHEARVLDFCKKALQVLATSVDVSMCYVGIHRK